MAFRNDIGARGTSQKSTNWPEIEGRAQEFATLAVDSKKPWYDAGGQIECRLSLGSLSRQENYAS